MKRIWSNGEKSFKVFSVVMLAIISIIAFMPFILILVTSFTDETTLIRDGYSFFPRKLSLEAYIYMVNQSSVILRAYGVSVLVTGVGTAISVLITSMLAYPMSRKDYRHHNTLAFIAFFTMLFNGGVVPSYIMWSRFFHVNNTYAALIVPTYLLSALNVLLVRNYFKNNVPGAVIESAQIDGASEFRIFFRIMFPLSIPVIVTVSVFTGLVYWNDWINALYYINKPKYYGIQNLLIRLMNNIQFLKTAEASTMLGGKTVDLPSTSIRMTMAVLGMLPVVIAFPLLQKYIVKGVVIGAVKG